MRAVTVYRHAVPEDHRHPAVRELGEHRQDRRGAALGRGPLHRAQGQWMCVVCCMCCVVCFAVGVVSLRCILCEFIYSRFMFGCRVVFAM